MSIISGIYDVLQSQAALDQAQATAIDTRALAQQRMQGVALGNIKMQQNLNTQQALQQAIQGNNFDPSFDPTPEDDAVTAARKNVARLQQQANFARKAASAIMRQGGDPSVADKYIDDAMQAGWRATQGQRELMTEQKNIVGQIAGIAAGVNDDDSLNVAMDQLRTVSPRSAETLAAQLDRDPFTGTFTYGPKSQTVMRTLANQGRTAEQQATDAIKVQTQLDRQAEIQRKAAKDAEETRVNDARIANLRASTALHEAQAGQVGQPRAVTTKPPGPVRPATRGEVDSARDAILADEDFKESKFDGSLGAFSADVADRAKKLLRDNPDMSADEAREQALAQLKPYVTDRTVGEKDVFGFKYGGEMKKTYTRGGATRAAKATEGVAPQITSQEQYDALPKGASYQWNGKTLIKK